MATNHYNSYRNYLKVLFGKPVLKIPVSGGFSCPNRDGTISNGGCIFCDNSSFSPVAQCNSDPVSQLNSIINRSSRYEAYLPYLQPYSNTYGSIESLKKVYEPLLSVPGVVGLAIGTRPDCFSNEIYEYLKDINSRTYLSVEIGLQSSHDSTLKMINRGHSFAAFGEVCKKLANFGIETVAHVMLGLPGETQDMMLETSQRLSMLPVNGIKIHQLMIIRGTILEQWFNEHKIAPISIEIYAELVSLFLSRLRPDQLIHRIMADSKSEFGLIVPQWSQYKNESIAFIHSYMKKNKVQQGSEYKISL